jgi:hypothetical protein
MAIYSIDSLLNSANSLFPAAGIWGYLTLLKGDVATGLAYTANATSNQLTTASAHGMVTGSRLRLVGGVLPTPLLANTDYFAIVSSATVLSLAASLADAVSATAIDLTDAGSGALTLTEQVLTAADPLSVLVNKEVSHPAWVARAVVDNLGTAVVAAGTAVKPPKVVAVTNTAGTPLTYAHYLYIASAAAGSLGSVPPGAGFLFESAAAAVTLAPSESRSVTLNLKVRNL